jgi:hypothetical protein
MLAFNSHSIVKTFPALMRQLSTSAASALPARSA